MKSMSKLAICSYLAIMACLSFSTPASADECPAPDPATIKCGDYNAGKELKYYSAIFDADQCANTLKCINYNIAVVRTCGCERWKSDEQQYGRCKNYLAIALPEPPPSVPNQCGETDQSVYYQSCQPYEYDPKNPLKNLNSCPKVVLERDRRCCVPSQHLIDLYVGLINLINPIFGVPTKPRPGPDNSCIAQAREYDNRRAELLSKIQKFNTKVLSSWNHENQLHERQIYIKLQKVRQAEDQVVGNLFQLGFQSVTQIITGLTGACPREDDPRVDEVTKTAKTFCKNNGKNAYVNLIRRYFKAMGDRNGAIKQVLDTEKTWRGRLSRAYRKVKSGQADVLRGNDQLTTAYNAWKTCRNETLGVVLPTVPTLPPTPEFIVKEDGCFRIPALGGLFCGNAIWCNPNGKKNECTS